MYVTLEKVSIFYIIVIYYMCGQLCAPTWEGRAVDDKNEMYREGSRF